MAASKIPGNDVQPYHAIAAPQTIAVTHDIALNECLSVHGATMWLQQAYASSNDTPAVQDTFVFATPAAAGGAYQTLRKAMTGCQAHSRAVQAAAHLVGDATVTQTAQATSGTAWMRKWTGAAGISAGGAQTNHIYLSYRGSALTTVQVTAFPGKTPADPIDTANDAAVLATLNASLGT